MEVFTHRECSTKIETEAEIEIEIEAEAEAVCVFRLNGPPPSVSKGPLRSGTCS